MPTAMTTSLVPDQSGWLSIASRSSRPVATPKPKAQPDLHRDPPNQAEARELALLYAHRAGDESALAELLESYQDRLYSVCLRMVGNTDRARDLTQDALVKIILGIDRFSGRSKLSTWMIRVTMNVCLTDMRRMKLRRHASLDTIASASVSEGRDEPFSATLEGKSEPSVHDRVEQREALARVEKAMRGVGEDHRVLLILRDIQGLDYRQIADLLEVPVGTVKSRLFRARAALRAQVESGDAEAPG